ncbi:MAG TPA: hypothetical protein VFC25_17385 [Verrucomicrobiae bacterium]|nr:hypothetical protein [Verrucomicrobiae bacterium]
MTKRSPGRVRAANRQVIRKERPQPPAKPPARPPSPSGIRAPGNGAPANGMICPGTNR